MPIFGSGSDAENIEEKINDLENDYPVHNWSQGLDVAGFFTFGASERLNFGKFWARVKEINEEFRQSDIPKAERHQLRTRLSALCERAKEVQEIQNREYDEACDENYTAVYNAIARLKQDFDLTYFSEITGNHSDIRTFWPAQSEIRQMFKDLKPMRKGQRQELWDDLNEVCDLIRGRQDEIREAKQQKHEEWKDRMSEKLSRLRDVYEKNSEFITRLENQIEDLEQQIASAYSESFVDRAEGWVQEKRDKISEVEDKNQDIMEKIEEIEGKLND